jgi:hypothetical protein
LQEEFQKRRAES